MTTIVGTPAIDRLRSVSRSHWRELDGIRGLAILMVIVYHANYASPAGDSIAARLFSLGATSGWIGVRLFFVLSGFLIGGILLDSRGEAGALRRFIVRRSLRIFPPYFVLLALCIWILPQFVTMPAGFSGVGAVQGWYWSYLSNWTHPLGIGVPALAHTWSLSLEEQFYLLAPLAVLYLTRASLNRLLVGTILVSVGIRAALAISGYPLAGYMFTIAQLDALGLGCLLAVVVRDPVWSAKLAQLRPMHLYAPVLLLAVLFVARRGLIDTDVAVLAIGQVIIAAVSAGLIVAAAAPDAFFPKRLKRVLSSETMVQAGRLSYSMYLVHLPVLHFMQEPAGALIGRKEGAAALPYRVGLVLAVLAVSAALAMVMDRLLELPIRRLKERSAPRRTAAGAMPMEPSVVRP